ncbi:uncharacterized protein LOC114843053 [Betta splendens]|uniref:Uncharacterized protein LOC114843053 n=1 Tax=Betta splendens TaxID=158456 RepID=A0A6P7KWT9_BETSP|nr:uncharacterized protein LOC114843053 [Betta splendens]
MGRYVTVVLPGSAKILTLCEVEVYGYRVPTAANIARQGTATQSSLYPKGEAYRAIDGNRASNWGKGSCIHTNLQLCPWWRVDLHQTYKVFFVTITNRDAHSNRLNGAEIRIGDSLAGNGNNNPRCTVISSIPAGATQSFQCNGMNGRYVNVVIPGRKEYLTLCEVEVYGSRLDLVMMKLSAFLPLLLLSLCSASKYPNVAMRGKAAQSDRYEHIFGSASNAIDGYPEPHFHAGSCTHTDEESNPWWRLDLLETYIITSITITNRGDCCAERIRGLQIRIGNSLANHGLGNPIARTLNSADTKMTVTFSERVEGRVVTMVLPGVRRILTLCEVEVYGYRAPTGENLAVKGKASQSSVYQFGLAYNSVDGNRATKWEQGSCSRTNKNFEPWWRLDLGTTHKVFSINITNSDDNPESLNGAEIRVGDSLDDDGNNNPKCGMIDSIQAGATVEVKCSDGMDGRYVNVVVRERAESLSLCEVEVFGSRLD